MPPPSIGWLRVLLSRAQLAIWAFVTPDVTPSSFRCAFSSLNLSDKPLILNMERVKGDPPTQNRHKGSAQTARVRAILAGTTALSKSTWLVR